MFKDVTGRMKSIFAMLFTETLKYELTSYDRWFVSNQKVFRNHLKNIMDARKANLEAEKDSNLLTMLLRDETYSQLGYDVIICDVLGMCMAGTTTIQVSSTSTVIMTMFNQDVKKRIVAEVDSVLGPISDDLLGKFTIETSDNLEYLMYCYLESLRINPPAPLTSSAAFSEDVELGGVKIGAGVPIMHNII